MKKNYVTLWLSVTMFEPEDIVTGSVAWNTIKSGFGVDATETWWSED